jgi:enoyl-CoA hydratase
VSEPPDGLVLVERHDAVAVVTLNRPRQLNALSDELMQALDEALTALDGDAGVRAVVLAGAGRAFAAGADVAALARASAMDMYLAPRLQRWERVRAFGKPLIAAVHGHCLGGGCELALTCDIVVAADDARFGQPETNLGIVPGAGGTQRTARVLGKSLTMELVLAGRVLTADEALAHGLCSRVVAREALLREAVALARRIASRSPVAIRLAREAVQQSFETPLAAGLAFERRALYLAFASEDAREGLQAFVDRRQPEWKGR